MTKLYTPTYPPALNSAVALARLWAFREFAKISDQLSRVVAAGGPVDADRIELAGASVVAFPTGLALAGDVAAPGSLKVYSTDAAGAKGWFPAPASGIADAPSDGKDYARNNAAWLALDWTTLDGKPARFPPNLPGGTTANVLYKNSATDFDYSWTALHAGDITGLQATLDGKADLYHTHDEYALSAIQLLGAKSISGGGNLTVDSSFELVNDLDAPGILMCYGTNKFGAKGWVPLPQQSYTANWTLNILNAPGPAPGVMQTPPPGFDAASTVCWLADHTLGGIDIDTVLDQVRPGDELYIEDQTDTTRTRTYTIIGDIDNNAGTYIALPIEWVASTGGAIPNGVTLKITISPQGSGGGGGGGSGGIPEAPTDGADYFRNMGAWIAATWASLDGKPATFAPSAHGHPWTDLTGVPATFPPDPHNHPWSDITGAPSAFPPDLTVTDPLYVNVSGDSMTGNLSLFPAGAAALTVQSQGAFNANVNIGTATFTRASLGWVHSTNLFRLQLRDAAGTAGTAQSAIEATYGDSLSLMFGGVEKLRTLTNGAAIPVGNALVVGNTATVNMPGSGAPSGTRVQMHNVSNLFANSAYGVVSWGNNNIPAGIYTGKSRSGTVGAFGVNALAASDPVGEWRMFFDDSATLIEGAKIIGTVLAVPAVGAVQTRLSLWTMTAAGGYGARLALDSDLASFSVPVSAPSVIGNWLVDGFLCGNSQASLVGYTTGAGGVVVQATSKVTGVTLDSPTGRVTMALGSMAAGEKVSFTVTCAACGAASSVIVAVAVAGTANAYRADITAIAAGSFNITVENISAGALNQQPQIRYAVLRGANS